MLDQTSRKCYSPALAEWLDTLPEGYKKSAETLIAKLSALPIDEEEDRKLMYRHGILALERMKLRGSTEEFVTSIESADRLLAVLADRDSLEASLYWDILKSRLDAIRDFQTTLMRTLKSGCFRSICSIISGCLIRHGSVCARKGRR